MERNTISAVRSINKDILCESEKEAERVGTDYIKILTRQHLQSI